MKSKQQKHNKSKSKEDCVKMKFYFLVLVFSILALESVKADVNDDPEIANSEDSNNVEEELSSGDQTLEQSENLSNVTIEREENNETVVEKVTRHPIKKVTCLPNKGSNATVSKFSDIIYVRMLTSFIAPFINEKFMFYHILNSIFFQSASLPSWMYFNTKGQ